MIYATSSFFVRASIFLRERIPPLPLIIQSLFLSLHTVDIEEIKYTIRKRFKVYGDLYEIIISFAFRCETCLELGMLSKFFFLLGRIVLCIEENNFFSLLSNCEIFILN